MTEFDPPIESRETDELILISFSSKDEWQEEAIDQAVRELEKRGFTEEFCKKRISELERLLEAEWALELELRRTEDYTLIEKFLIVLWWPREIFSGWSLRKEGYKLMAKRRIQLITLGILMTGMFLVWANNEYKISNKKLIDEIEKIDISDWEKNRLINTVSGKHQSPTDTMKPVKLGNDLVTPRASFEFHSFIYFQGDTLGIVACSEYVYFPFGLIMDKTELNKSELKNFNAINKIEKTGYGEFEFQKLSLDSNRIILFFDNDLESIKRSYIFKGVIVDDQVVFVNNIKIGMTNKEFIHTFFSYFPDKLIDRYSTIILESCVQDIQHTYRFNNNILESVKFDSDSNWKIDYN